MKVIITMLLCAIGATAFGQTASYPNDAYRVAVHYNDTSLQLTDTSLVTSDTLVMTDTSIHFIRIGAKVFEIKRMLRAQPSPCDNTWRNAMPSVQLYNLQN